MKKNKKLSSSTCRGTAESIANQLSQLCKAMQSLQVLDAYLIDNPQQHIYCKSPDSKYVSLIMYATKIEIDLCNLGGTLYLLRYTE